MRKRSPIVGAVFFSLAASAVSWGSTQETPQTAMLMRLPGMSAAPAVAPAFPDALVSNFTNYPNPFDSRKAGLEGKTTIAYTLANDSQSTLTIYDLLGKKVLTWSFRAGQNGGRAGTNQLLWDGTNDHGQKVSKGGYIAELEIDSPNANATALRKIGLIH